MIVPFVEVIKISDAPISFMLSDPGRINSLRPSDAYMRR